MKRQSIILFLIANMKDVTIPYVKANQASFGISGTVTQSAVKAYLNNDNTSDEDIIALGEACGYTEDSTPATAPAIAGLKAETVEIEDANGAPIQVPCYLLTVKSWGYQKSRTGILTPCLKMDFAGKTLTAFSELFREKSVRDAIAVGDTVAVREDSRETINGTGRDGNPYITYRGAVLEASVPSMIEARANLLERELDLAQMSKAGQSMLSEQSAKSEVQAFLAKYGR